MYSPPFWLHPTQPVKSSAYMQIICVRSGRGNAKVSL